MALRIMGRVGLRAATAFALALSLLLSPGCDPGTGGGTAGAPPTATGDTRPIIFGTLVAPPDSADTPTPTSTPDPDPGRPTAPPPTATPIPTATPPGGNKSPIANAGEDIQVSDTDKGGSETVTLDASGSSDTDGTITQYVWEEGGAPLGAGPSTDPTLVVELAVGTHSITLKVTDDGGDRGQDTVRVTVLRGDTTVRATIDLSAGDPDDWSRRPFAIGANGRFMAFESEASDLVPDDTNGVADVFVLDRQDGTITRVSVSSGGEQGNQASREPSMSADGRLIVFKSFATNLVAGDTNGSSDIFLRDRVARLAPDADPGITIRISAPAAGSGAYEDSALIPFTVDADPVAEAGDDLQVTDTDNSGDEVVMLNGSESVDPDGTIVSYEWTTLNDAGEQVEIGTGPVARATFTLGVHLVTLRVTDGMGQYDSDTVQVTVVAGGDAGGSDAPTANAGADVEVTDADDSGNESVTLSGADSTASSGTIASYQWTTLDDAGDVVELGTDVNIRVTLTVGVHLIFLRVTDDEGRTDDDSVRVTVLAAGGGGAGAGGALPGTSLVEPPVVLSGQRYFGSFEPYISLRGDHVVYTSRRLQVTPAPPECDPQRFFVVMDVYLYDRRLGTTSGLGIQLVGRSDCDQHLDNHGPSVSDDGRTVAYLQENELGLFDTNRVAIINTHIGSAYFLPAVENAAAVRVSGDGRYVTFSSNDDAVVPEDDNGRRDVFVYSLTTGHYERASMSTAGEQGDGGSGMPSISVDGRYVAFESLATNLTGRTTTSSAVGATMHVFLRDRQTGVTEQISLNSGGVAGNADSWSPVVSFSGEFVIFATWADNLFSGTDENQAPDIAIRERAGR